MWNIVRLYRPIFNWGVRPLKWIVIHWRYDSNTSLIVKRIKARHCAWMRSRFMEIDGHAWLAHWHSRCTGFAHKPVTCNCKHCVIKTVTTTAHGHYNDVDICTQQYTVCHKKLTPTVFSSLFSWPLEMFRPKIYSSIILQTSHFWARKRVSNGHERCSCWGCQIFHPLPYCSVVSRQIVMKLFSRINHNIILHQAAVADICFRP